MAPTVGHKVHVLSFDCLQYYVLPYVLQRFYARVDPVFYVVGLNYFPFPGTYPYLCGNGRVIIAGSLDGLATVKVCTNGGGLYMHNLSLYKHRIQSVRLGFTTVYFHVTKKMWESYSFVPLPSCSYDQYSLLANAAIRSKL